MLVSREAIGEYIIYGEAKEKAASGREPRWSILHEQSSENRKCHN